MTKLLRTMSTNERIKMGLGEGGKPKFYSVGSYHPESEMEKLVREAGYPIERYEYTTDDGYILTAFRIPHSKYSNNEYNDIPKPVVYLQHGIMACSTQWVLGDSTNSLGFLLADKGYDVWMANLRGGLYTQKHTTLSRNSSEFWQFSFHEMGLNDVSATIDFILGITGQSHLDYIGHSMGTTVFFILMSSRPEYNHKVRRMIALAPVAYMGHMTSPVRILMIMNALEYYVRACESFSSPYGQIFRSSSLINGIISTCSNKLSTPFSKVMTAIVGGNDSMYNYELYKSYFTYIPCGTSMRTFAHFGQLYWSGKFSPWEYSSESQNIKQYGCSPPKEYPLEKVTTPVYTFWTAEHDKYSNGKDVAILESRLGNLKGSIQLKRDFFGHYDYNVGKDVDTEINQRVLKILTDTETS